VSLVDKITLPDNSYYQFTYEPTPGYSGDVTGRIASVKLPTGGTISYSYSGGNNGITCADGSTATLTRTTPDGIWKYVHTESGTAWTTVVTDPKSDTNTLNFQDVYINTTTEVARSDYETERQVNDVSGGLLQTVVSCYNGNISANCNSTAVSVPILRKTVFPQPQGSSNLESEIDTTFNNYGLTTKIDEYDYGTAPSPGPLVRETQIGYASLGNDIQDRPAQVSVYAGSNLTQPVAQTAYTYDQGTPITTSGTPQHVSVSGSRGNLTTVASLVQGPTSLTKTYSYYDTGNVYQATDTNNAVTTYTYGACGNSFPTQVSLPLNLSASATWDCNGGVTTQTNDANNQPTQIGYGSDPFWRPITVTDPENNVTTNTYTATTRESVLNFSSSTVDVLTTLDSIGRTKLVQKRRGPGLTNFDTVQDSYDSNGRLTKVTQPCVNTAGNGCTGAATTTTYNALNRPATVTDGVGGTLAYTYANNDILQDLGPAPAGENDKKKQLEYDGLGRLSSVCEITGATGSGTCQQVSSATGYWTKYAYDALDNLQSVSQNVQGSPVQSRGYSYDGLSRMTSESNPESGTTTYFWDTGPDCSGWGSAGNLAEKKDQAGIVSCYAFDALDRIQAVAADHSKPVYNCKNFVYDTTSAFNSLTPPAGSTFANIAGRMSEAYVNQCNGANNISSDEWFSYSPRGENTDVYESTPHSGGFYHTTVSFWPNGALESLGGVGQQSAYTYALDGEGRPYSVTQGSTNYVSSTTYNAASQPLIVSLYNNDGDNDAYQYDTIGRLTNYTFTVGSTPKSMGGVLTWNTNSSLSKLAITDGFNSGGTQTCKYGDPGATPPVAGYDDLGRLISVSCNSSPAWSQAFSFDPFGNITKTGTSAWTPGYNQATNRYALGGTSYDTNGNLLNDSFHSYLWDANNHPTTVTSPNGTTTCNSSGVTCLTYDAFGRMVEKNASGTYSEIEYSPVGKVAVMSGSTQLQAYVPLPGGEMLSPGPDTFWHTDWLASVRLASSANNRTITFDHAFAPYGEMYNNVIGGTGQNNFTGLTRDTISDEYDTIARELHPGQSRWISPDPAGVSAVNPADPQTWNRYAYVRNNPLAAIDPTGMRMCQSVYGCGGGSGGGGVAGCDNFGCWAGYGNNAFQDVILVCGSSCPWPYSCDLYGCYVPVTWTVNIDTNYGDLTPYQSPGIRTYSSVNGKQISKVYSLNTRCSSDASQVMQSVESNFTRFGNYSAWGDANAVTFFPPAGMGPGSNIWINIEALSINQPLSVTVDSMDAGHMTFTTNPGHLLYPAYITFSAGPASPGSINFYISLEGTVSMPTLFEFGGGMFEDAQWNNFLAQVRAFCN
jgi:RHS repeat-associated protein